LKSEELLKVELNPNYVPQGFARDDWNTSLDGQLAITRELYHFEVSDETLTMKLVGDSRGSDRTWRMLPTPRSVTYTRIVDK
jgi:hypothetical protein